MENLKNLNYNAANDFLKQAEAILIASQSSQDPIPDVERVKLLALTYNNMGCLFKKYLFEVNNLKETTVLHGFEIPTKGLTIGDLEQFRHHEHRWDHA